jgi:pantoate kinase
VIVICGSFGEIHTKSILTDPQLNKNIKIAGKKAFSRLLNKPSLKNFIKFSYQFVKDSKILSILNLYEIEQLLKDLNKIDII